MIDENSIKDRISLLVAKIRHYDYMYYIENKSIISDYDYDLLRLELENLEEQYPHLREINSPTQTIGFYHKSEIFTSKKHLHPMLSLKNTYLIEDIIDFIDKNFLLPVVLEPKIDGVSISLHYSQGHLISSLLRGDGSEGEDVTENILYVKDILKIISLMEDIEIRGELYINKENFINLNKERNKNMEKQLQNSRNGTSGLIRQRNKYNEYLSYISFVPYNILKKNGKFFHNTQIKTLTTLKSLGFKKQNYILCKERNLIEKEIQKIYEKISSVVDIDGIVIKTNDLDKMANLGSTSRHPLGAIAYKFSSETKEVKIKEIIWQVSRNGKLTPVSNIEPVLLGGAKISKVTLHNKEFLRKNKIGIGSIILIERVGAAVPQIKSVITPTTTLIKITHCPSCNNTIEETDFNYICINKNCTERMVEQLIYFCKSLKIKGLGTKAIEELTKQINKPSELIKLIGEGNSLKVVGWDKICFNLKNILKNVDSKLLLVSLGVENLSLNGMAQITKTLEISSLEDLKAFIENEDYKEKLTNLKIHGIGGEKLQSFIKFIQTNKKEILQIIEYIQKII